VAKQRVDWTAWRARAQAIREDAVGNLPGLLADFESRVVAAGGTVHHAATAEDARRIVVGLCTERGLTRAVKSKSMLTEELGINPALEGAGIASIETDLGEYIVQLLGDRPSHILAPAVHLSAVDVAKLFGHPDPEDTSGLVAHARSALRAAFLEGDVGITGVNFGIASTGTLVLVESEGNIRMCTSLPRVHIALMGVEKILRDWDAAGHMVQMLPLAAHGKPAATYTSYVTGIGGASSGDDGPDELHVVLVDDGRLALRGTELESALNCIRCGACLYACPVYRQVGGHAYGTAYSGPIGAVITPALEGSAGGTAELAWMSSLCGACTEACPVGIPLDEHLVTLRASAVRADPSRAQAAFWEAWSRLWARPGSYRALAVTGGKALAPAWAAAVRVGSGSGSGDGWISRAPYPFSGWTSERDAPGVPRETFRERWRKVRGPGSGSDNGRTDAVAGPPEPVAPGAASALSEGVRHVGGNIWPSGDEPPSRAEIVEEFGVRVVALDGVVHVVDTIDDARAVARDLVAGATVSRWADPELDGIADADTPAESAEVSILKADVGVSFTGAIGFAHHHGRPRRSALLPDRQIALLHRDRIVATTQEALATYFTDEATTDANVVFAAGPSRTADIEQRMMLGVHAPRSLDIVVYG